MSALNVGIIGSGFGARVALPCFSMAERVNVIAFASRNPDKVSGDIKPYGVPHLCGSLKDMLSISELDMVCIETPPFAHRPMVEQAINAGKHVLCEKPMALNAAEAIEMLELAQAHPLQMCVIGHQLRFQLNLRKIKSLIDSGAIGFIRHIDFRYFTASRYDAGVAWDWWSDAESGGGQLNALGSHFIDLLCWWLGKAKSVQGHIGTFHKSRLNEKAGEMKDVTSDEYASFDLFFEGGAWASLRTSSVVCDEPGIEIHVIGSEGTVALNRDDQLTVYKDKGSGEDITANDPLLSDPVIGVNQWRTSLVRYAEHIAQAILDEKPFEGATFKDGVQTQMILDAVRLSDKEKRNVNVDGIRQNMEMTC